jgi:ankyrin repeat protein
VAGWSAVSTKRRSPFSSAPRPVDERDRQGRSDMEWNGNIDDGKLHRAVIGPGSGTDKLRQLLRTASPAAIDSSDPAGYTILMAAIKGGKSDRAVMLIDSGADITPVNASGWWRLGHRTRPDAAVSASSQCSSLQCSRDDDPPFHRLAGRPSTGPPRSTTPQCSIASPSAPATCLTG